MIGLALRYGGDMPSAKYLIVDSMRLFHWHQGPPNLNHPCVCIGTADRQQTTGVSG